MHLNRKTEAPCEGDLLLLPLQRRSALELDLLVNYV
jgi:hypothetical protein